MKVNVILRIYKNRYFSSRFTLVMLWGIYIELWGEKDGRRGEWYGCGVCGRDCVPDKWPLAQRVFNEIQGNSERSRHTFFILLIVALTNGLPDPKYLSHSTQKDPHHKAFLG